MDRFGFNSGIFLKNYFTEGKIDKLKVEKAALDLLSKAVKGTKKQNMKGKVMIPLLLNNTTVGKLFEDIDINLLKVDGFWVTPSGIKVNLTYNGNVVGMIWLSE